MDMNDRSLRKIVIGLGGTANGVPREDGFNITAASEIMAILCLSSGIQDLKEKMGNILLGFKHDKSPAYARELKAEGPMAILLKDAINPNLVQTLEGNPAIIHGGPFANIAQGTNSVIATKMGLSLSEYVVTEAGFGSDLGAEKFLNIKCGYSGLKPRGLVIVATVRALRHHGGVGPADVAKPNLEAVKAGMPNLDKHIENSKLYKLTPVVAINHFPTDSKAEIKFIQDHCAAKGVKAVLSKGWEFGGEGTTDLAEAVVEVVESGVNDDFQRLYNWNSRPMSKIETIAKNVYGADRVEFIGDARRQLDLIKEIGLDHLPVCIAKTQKSLSDNDRLLGRPEGFTITVREIEIAAGAGFIIPITGTMLRMPGLPAISAAEGMDIDAKGRITGLH
jgi:formate--tetrahydrofolate ligase